MKRDQLLKWLMSGLFLASALILSSNMSFSKYGYVCFAAAHILGIVVFYHYRDHAMLWNNIIFLIVDIWGIYRWF